MVYCCPKSSGWYVSPPALSSSWSFGFNVHYNTAILRPASLSLIWVFHWPVCTEKPQWDFWLYQPDSSLIIVNPRHISTKGKWSGIQCANRRDILPLPGSAGMVGGKVELAGMATSQVYYFTGPFMCPEC